ncbi:MULTISPECIES: 3-deoxy-D-manno-octulosonic acid transferase [Deefgea]|uniref:3-deoxy-D-manno-octulosonic acid transferase n=1 Tax=Deefgea chitinilytica TaxID=570276 RepID=A0ABS2CEA8_9NEIS|nr:MULTISPECIES: 3-deoxy-D-manno-octulosonic acid transferase [Deefgea]MBM5572471.1 3-deoxy-D-manno-octulosonic acid transferase [Deefgea chitinilytica]MBM9889707.1 3-deoxy-D-manno-octulosonic acid transferase [Deefgea sp. CFH1-16]
MIARGLYRLLLWLVFPLIWLYLLKRSKKQPEYRDFWLERLGYYSLAIKQQFLQSNTSPVWLHAVSVGEMRASAPVIAALRQLYPTRPLLLTCMTPTGRATAQELFGAFATIVYLPYDYPSAMRRFLCTFQPQCGVVMETEIWPNLIHECADAGIPLVLANARLSEKSYRGYQKARALIRPAMARWANVLAQAPADAARLAQLGAIAPQVMGSVKFDNQIDLAKVELGQQWRSQFASRRVVLLASSRDGEEAEFLAQWRGLFTQQVPLLIIVPRHPQRFDAVADLIANQGFSVLRRSQWQSETVVAADILLGDSMGEMLAWFSAADITVMGGSLLPFGSQNFIEACAVGCPVLLGPHTYNFAAAAEAALAEGAAWQGQSLADVMVKIPKLLNDANEREPMRRAGIQFAQAHRGATTQLMRHLAEFLSPQ